MSRKIGIIGSGAVARTLGSGFLQHGFQVMLGSRDPSKLADWKKENGKRAQTGSFADSASFGDIVVLAVVGRQGIHALELSGAENINGKTIIDATNPIGEAPPQNGVLKFFTDLDKSLMEQYQNAFPEAHFVKAFNSVGSRLMVNPALKTRPTMFICGNSESAKGEVNGILDQFGWEVSDLGGVEAARAIEPLCILWCIPGLLRNEWDHAFKLLKL